MAYQAQSIKALISRAEGKLSRYQNSNAQSLLMEQRRILQAVDGITSMRNHPSSLETPAAHTLKLTRAAKKLSEESNKIRERVNQAYLRYASELAQAINDRAGIKQDAYASEIRALYRSLNDQKKMEMILDAVNNVDASTFSALMLAPKVLTGISSKLNQDMSKNFYSKAAPDLCQEQNDLQEAMDAIISSISVADGVVNQFSNPDIVKQIEDEIQKAQEATEKFTAAVA